MEESPERRFEKEPGRGQGEGKERSSETRQGEGLGRERSCENRQAEGWGKARLLPRKQHWSWPEKMHQLPRCVLLLPSLQL